MSALLTGLASEIGINERTLRRAINAGTIHAVRSSPQTLEIAPAECSYVRSHWPLIGALRRALRTEPNVNAAVLFGSTARGDDGPASDVDLLVWLRGNDIRARRELRQRLEQAIERAVQLTDAGEAEEHAMFLESVLRDGRVLVDRQHRWSELRARTLGIHRRANRERRELARRVRLADEFFGARV